LLTHPSEATASDVMNYSFDTDGNQRKSVTLAVVYSLLVPGMGQTYVGSFRTGKYYLFAEGGLWLTYSGFQIYGNWLHQDAQSYATEHAAANFSGKDDQFEVNIGNFNTMDEYNQQKRNNRQYDLMYTGSQYQWDWGRNDANRLQFKSIRIHSASVYDNSRFIIGAVVVNHIISAFMAGRAAAAYNRSLADEQSWHIDALALGNVGNIHGIELSFTKIF
jgi:TM2 domain-containing membrane protein YozV